MACHPSKLFTRIHPTHGQCSAGMVMVRAIILILSISSCGLVYAQTLLQQQHTNCTYTDFKAHACRKGQYLNDGRCDEKRVCCHCPRNTWMPYFNMCPHCTPHTDCAGLGKELIGAGNRTHDNVCGDKLEQVTTQLISTRDATSIRPPVATTSTTQQQRILSEIPTSDDVPHGPSTSSVQLCSCPPSGDEPKDYILMILLVASVAGNIFLLISKYKMRSDHENSCMWIHCRETAEDH